MGGDGWAIFGCFVAAKDDHGADKKKEKMVPCVCKEHAMMYQDYTMEDDEKIFSPGRLPSVTIQTKQNLLGEFMQCMKKSNRASKVMRELMSDRGGVEVVDSTNVEFINSLLVLVWPRMSKVIQAAMDELVEPAIREAVPQIKGSFELETNMGTIPPRLGPMKTFRDSDNAISIETGITWNSDLKVKVEASILTITVDSLQIHGNLVVKLCPLIDEIPLVGALHIYFLDPPDVDMRIRIKRSPLKLNNVINDAIDQGIRDAMVLPNRILAPVAGLFQLKSIRPLHNPSPVGVLILTVLEMKNLPAADTNILGRSSVDAYVRVGIGSEIWKSKPVRGNLNPVFKVKNVRAFSFFTKRQNVRFSVWDSDIASGDDCLGKLAGLKVEHCEGEHWFDLEVEAEFLNKEQSKGWCMGSTKKNMGMAGKPKVLLRGEICTMSTRAKYDKNSSKYLLEVAIVGIRKAKGETLSPLYATCSAKYKKLTLYAPACLPNIYADPDFIEKKIDPMLVHKLSMEHTPEQISYILDITKEQVIACQNAGHEGIWCHTWYFNCKTKTGEIELMVQDAVKGGKFDTTISFADWTSESGQLEIAYDDLKIGPFVVDVKLMLHVIVPPNDDPLSD